MLETDNRRERSIVSVLIVDVVNSTNAVRGLSVDEAEAFSDLILDYLRKPVERLGGFFANFAGDGGTAIFGWPNSLEDHAYCAVRAAWDIQNPPPGANPFAQSGAPGIRFRIGIHSGLIGMRRIALTTGPYFDTSGEVVHLAAQLEKSADPGSIVVSGETLSLCRDHVPVEGPGPVRFRVSGPPLKQDYTRLSGKFRKPIFGREAELESVCAALSGTLGGPSTCAVWGEPGIGKSRLAIEALRRLHGQPFGAILVALCDTPDSNRPFNTLLALLREATGLGHGASDKALLAALDLDGQSDEARRIVERTLDAAGDKTRREESQPTTLQTGRALVEVLKTTVAGRPTLLAVEDYHLIDPESAQALALLAEHCTGPDLALLVTSRPEAAEAVTALCAHAVELAPLPRAALQQIAGTDDAADMTALARRSGGNPLYFEQLLIGAADNPAAGVPLSVESLVHARLNALEPREKSVAQSLSILGEDVELDLARHVLGMDLDVLHKALGALDQYAIISPPAAGRIRFRHALIAEACATSLSALERRALHQDTMGAIQAIYPELSGYYERLAHHAEAADLVDEAVEFLRLAALQAKRQSANHTLARLFDRAMRLMQGHEQRMAEPYVDFVLICFDPMQQIGEYDRLRGHMERAAALARDNGWQARAGGLLCLLGMIYWIYGRYAEGISATDQAIAIGRAEGSLPLQVHAAFVKSLSLHGAGRVADAIAIQSRLAAGLTGDLETKRLGSAGIPAVIVRGFLAWAASDSRAETDWETEIEHALRIARDEREYYSEIAALLGQTRCLLRAGRASEAARAAEHGLEIAVEYGFHAAKAHMTGLAASALARAGDGPKALQLVADCLSSGHAHAAGDLAFFALLAGRAEAEMVTGDLTAAQDTIAQAVGLAHGLTNPALLADGLRVQAAVLNGRGDADAAATVQMELDRLISDFALPDPAPVRRAG